MSIIEAKEPIIKNDTVIALCHLVAGSSSASIAKVILYPIEQYNIRKAVGSKSNARIITTRIIIDDFMHLRIDNILDIYRGLQFGIFEKFMYNGIYFFFYSKLKSDWKRKNSTINNPREMPLGVALLRGTIAGIFAQIFSSPLGTIQKILQTTRKQDKDFANSSQIFLNVKERHGLSALWSGFGMSMVLTILPAINVYAYEHIRTYLNVSLGLKSAAIDFLSGLLSKAIAVFICYPLIYIKSRQQADHSSNASKSVSEIVVRKYNQSGIMTFYSGLKSKLIQSSLNNAVMFMIKEKIVIYTFAIMHIIYNYRQKLMKRT